MHPHAQDEGVSVHQDVALCIAKPRAGEPRPCLHRHARAGPNPGGLPEGWPYSGRLPWGFPGVGREQASRP
jgi:hypothetical protein